MTARYVTVKKYVELSGYTEDAIRNKTAKGIWIEGQQWRKAPDGGVMIDTIGVEKWVEGQLAPSKRSRAA